MSQIMTIPKPTRKGMQRKKPQNSEAPLRKASQAPLNCNQVSFKDICETIHVGNQIEDMNVVNQADWGSVIHDDLTGESCGEHSQGGLEDQEQRAQMPCTQEIAYSSSKTEAGRLDQCKQFYSHQVIHPGSPEKGPHYLQKTHVTGQYYGPQEGFSNYTAFHERNQGQTYHNLHDFGASLAGTFNAQNIGKFGRMIQQAEMQGQASAHIDQSWQRHDIHSQGFSSTSEGHRPKHIPASCNMDPNAWSFQGKIIQNYTVQSLASPLTEGAGFRTGSGPVETSQQDPTACSQKVFPSQFSPSGEFWMNHDTTIAGPCMEIASGSEAIQGQGFPPYVGTVSNVQGKNCQSPVDNSNTDCQILVTEMSQNCHAVQRHWTSTYSSYSPPHGNQFASGANSLMPPPATRAPGSMDSHNQMGANSSNSVYKFPTYEPAAKSHHGANIDEDLEGLDALSNQWPTVCSKASEKTSQQRLTLLRKELRNGLVDGTYVRKDKAFVGLLYGVGGRLSVLRSELRKGNHINELLGDGEPQTKQRRKKIRCKVQKDITRPRGRRRNGKAKHISQGAELHADQGLTGQDGKSAEVAIFSVEETTNTPEIAPCVDITTKVILDGQARFELVVPEKTFYSGECGSGFYSNRLEISPWNEQPTAIANYGPGHDLEKPQLVDFLALSDEKHRAGEMDCGASSSTHESQRLTSFGCQELVVYDQSNCQSQSIELPLSLFSGETSSTGSTDMIPSQESISRLPLARVNREDNMQLVLYNQKRDIVVSKIRTYKKIRAKVQLDPESQRVWLLLENGAAPQPETDAGRAKYWETQRGEMRRKVEHFIQKMHNVQGNRKFSPWKGSIVDSVVGAFLTQNVSDHLSSSAFMSVASRFPPISRSNTLVACPAVMAAFPYVNQSEVDTLPSITERVPFSSEENLALSKLIDSDCNNPLYADESCTTEVGLGDSPGYGKLLIQLDDRKPLSPCSRDIKQLIPSYTNAMITTPDSQSFDKQQQYQLLVSDDERNSPCDVDEDANNGGGLGEISGTFRQHCIIRSSKARRMLKFGTEFNKQQPELCSTIEPDKQVCLALMHTTETVSDNISDQQSESESAIGSFGSVHSVQDSNSQVSIVQEGNLEIDFQASTIQASSRELHVAAVAQKDPKSGKKRPLSLSSISGMERAQLEANQRGRKKNHHKDWESVRKQALGIYHCARDNFGGPEPRSSLHEDSVNWDAVRLADLGELADTIKERGMHHVLSGRIKAFLTSMYEEHGSIDLEWLRNLSSEKAREYLMSIHGLGVKSVECIRLLTLHHLAFPVDTNVGRICVRLGWVPIEPLPEEVQLHLVELYPIQETVQKYLWPRLCTLDQRTLYELHYQLITFGKVFCTKSKPNCNACPMRTECKHFASAYASAKPRLMGPMQQDESNMICSNTDSGGLLALGMDASKPALLEYPQNKAVDLSISMEAPVVLEIDGSTAFPLEYHQRHFGASYREFYVEEPTSPEQTFDQEIMDIEDMGKPLYIYNNYKDYSIELLGDDLSLGHPDHSHVSAGFSEDAKSVNIQSTNPSRTQFDSLPSLLLKAAPCSPHQNRNTEFASKNPCCGSQSITSSASLAERCSYSTDLIVEVAQTAIIPVPEAAQIPAPKLKSVGRLRTVHYVYELPDDHSLLKMVEVDAREKDDPCCYLLAIWSPGEIPESQQEIDEFCRDDYSTHCHGSADETVAGTLLIPCRTAMHGSFPLNGTYFQVNEVFADHASSLRPLQVPRSLIWSLRRRFVYFGTSVPNIFKGLSTEEIKDCFWRGHVCVRGFDRQSRAPKPLVCRLHFPISKQQKPNKNQGRKKVNRA